MPSKKWLRAQTLEPIHWIENAEKIADPEYRSKIKDRSNFVYGLIQEHKKNPTSGIEIGGGATGLIESIALARKVSVDPLMNFYLDKFPFMTAEALNITYLQGAGERLPVGDSEFDILLSRNVLDHVDNVDFCLKEMHRVMKDDGIAYIGMNVFGGPVYIFKSIFKDPEHPYTFSKSTFLKLIGEKFDILKVIEGHEINKDHFSEMDSQNFFARNIRKIFIYLKYYSILDIIVRKKKCD